MENNSVGCTEPSILIWPFCGKTLLWLAGSNRYILAEKPAALVIRQIVKGEAICTIIRFCIEEFNLSPEQAESFVDEIQQHLGKHLPSILLREKPMETKRTTVFASKKYYLIYGISFFVEYETKAAELLIHPKFEHLEVSMVQNHDHHFQVLIAKKECSLIVDGLAIGAWPISESHFLSGKFSMQILQKIYHKEEDDWMAVFHAAGITDGNNCLMFLGDSGNGKSTLSAILMTNGFEVLADDFLPVESNSGMACRFPAAISIKEKAYEMLTPLFPELMQTCEVNNPLTGKTFRHLPSDRQNPLFSLCKALIFVKYEKDAGFVFEEMPVEEAFKHLVPDSWISPTNENACRFVNWFASLPYYRMVYSDNEQMVQMVKKILSHDL